MARTTTTSTPLSPGKCWALSYSPVVLDLLCRYRYDGLYVVDEVVS